MKVKHDNKPNFIYYKVLTHLQSSNIASSSCHVHRSKRLSVTEIKMGATAYQRHDYRRTGAIVKLAVFLLVPGVFGRCNCKRSVWRK